MIKFFRKIRQQLLAQNKLGKYLLYALGEIVLVVIGILIALQINNWNEHRKSVKKERNHLLEIIENLREDLQRVEEIQKYNELKVTTIDSAFYYLSLMHEKPLLARDFSYLMPVISNYTLFTPTKVAFNNLTSTGNMDILQKDELRKEISRYYSSDLLAGVQEQLKVTTQNFMYNVAPKLINKNMMYFVTKRDFDLIPLTEIAVHKDPQVLSDLFVLQNKTWEQNALIREKAAEIKTLQASIEAYLNEHPNAGAN